ncbi:crossover junction endonuclease EME1 isoform X2 [Channa argus]|uniref:crossover junction endonuclease EME1 isoform X2 n=1 Tax=Channa argus TaxID=215402 RepID=UPI003520B4BA
MGSYSDATSDLEEELPVFDFLQPRPQLSQVAKSYTVKNHLVNLDDSEAEDAAVSSPVKGKIGACAGAADVMMVSSSSDDDDATYVPLAQRLKQRQNNVISVTSTVTNGKDAQQYSSSNLASSQLSCQNMFPESGPPLSFHQVRPINGRASDGPEDEVAGFPPQQRLPQKPLSSTGRTDMSLANRKPAKRTAEEIQASREEALKRKETRERQQRDKEALRQEQERQKAERKALAEASKALRPDECIKHMVVAVDPALLQLEGGGTLLASLQALGCSCAIEKQPIPRSVSWMRRVVCVQPEDRVCVPEAYVVMQMTVDDFITLIHSYIQEERNGKSDSGPTLTSWVQEQRSRNPGKVLSLVVTDLEKYFRRERDKTGFSFYLESEWAGGQRSDKAGKGLLQVWKRQIQQLNRVSPDMASAILAAYPSPQLLKKAYTLCKTDKERTSLLSDLLIRRGEGVTSTTRRVGPELSKRLFIMMNSCDPEQTLDSIV